MNLDLVSINNVIPINSLVQSHSPSTQNKDKAKRLYILSKFRWYTLPIRSSDTHTLSSLVSGTTFISPTQRKGTSNIPYTTWIG